MDRMGQPDGVDNHEDHSLQKDDLCYKFESCIERKQQYEVYSDDRMEETGES